MQDCILAVPQDLRPVTQRTIANVELLAASEWGTGTNGNIEPPDPLEELATHKHVGAGNSSHSSQTVACSIGDFFQPPRTEGGHKPKARVVWDGYQRSVNQVNFWPRLQQFLPAHQPVRVDCAVVVCKRE
jgi:hypothetical protein